MGSSPFSITDVLCNPGQVAYFLFASVPHLLSGHSPICINKTITHCEVCRYHGNRSPEIHRQPNWASVLLLKFICIAHPCTYSTWSNCFFKSCYEGFSCPTGSVGQMRGEGLVHGPDWTLCTRTGPQGLVLTPPARIRPRRLMLYPPTGIGSWGLHTRAARNSTVSFRLLFRCFDRTAFHFEFRFEPLFRFVETVLTLVRHFARRL